MNENVMTMLKKNNEVIIFAKSVSVLIQAVQ